jgi:hypothetical protein
MQDIITFQIIKLAIMSILFCSDFVLTFLFIVQYRKTFPEDKTYYDIEYNPILRFCWKKWGLYNGSLMGILIIYPFVLLYICLIIDRFFLGIVIGFYILTFIIHFTNLNLLFKKKWIKRKS